MVDIDFTGADQQFFLFPPVSGFIDEPPNKNIWVFGLRGQLVGDEPYLAGAYIVIPDMSTQPGTPSLILSGYINCSANGAVEETTRESPTSLRYKEGYRRRSKARLGTGSPTSAATGRGTVTMN